MTVNNGSKTKTIIIIFSILLILIFATSLYVTNELTLNTEKKSVTVVYIKNATNLQQTAQILKSSGIIRNKYIFITYAYFSGDYKRFYSGRYGFWLNTSYDDAIKKLKRGPKKTYFTLVINKGNKVSKIRESLSRDLLITKESFDSAFNKYRRKNKTFGEGYLFPGTYMFSNDIKVEEIFERLHNEFKNEIKKINIPKEYTEKDVVTIASIIQAETNLLQEQKLISAVIYNRLRKNIPLETDKTMQYILPNRNKKSSNIDSPYNTYRYRGLPPTPINSPGKSALIAAANPAKVNYLYYVLIDPKTGKHFFADNYEEFLKVKKKASK